MKRKHKCCELTLSLGKCKWKGKYKINNKHYCTIHYIEELMRRGLIKGEDKDNLSFLKIRFDILKRDNFKCVYCGRNPIEHKTILHIEHMKPKSKYPNLKKQLKNLVTSCKECNLGKSNKEMKEKDILLIKKRIKRLKNDK